jgi:uncharacterized FlaG/YvyC family protein
MATTKTIAGIQRGPDFDREAYEPSRVERVERSIKDDHNRQPETNDPLVRAAVEAGNEVATSMGGTKIDVKYDTKSGMVVIAVMSADGEKVIRYVPPEEAIREAQRRKELRSQYIENVI